MTFTDIPQVYLHRHFVDFRKSINGLTALVEMELELPVMSGALFVFCNKSRDKLKVLYWDKTGFALWYKRLEQDKFKWPTTHDETVMNLTAEQFHWLLSGYDIIGHQAVSYTSVAL